jgi:hypothetical protein
VAMHAVRRDLVEAQAEAAGLPLIPVMLPYHCTNEVYEDRMRAALVEARAAGITHMAFGDLFLVDVREYRVKLLEGTGIEPLFPIDASGTSDPDGDHLTFEWSIYPHDPEVATAVMIRGGDTATPRIEVIPTLRGKTVPVLLTIRDSGTPSLTRYGRVLLQVAGSQ